MDYYLLDVFTSEKYSGNQLAVFTNPPHDLASAEMQKIARELNLSETVFLFAPEKPQHAAKLRIFTPESEVPMAGHPTIGTAYLLAKENILPITSSVTKWIFEETIGPLEISVMRTANQQFTTQMAQPIPEIGEVFSNNVLIAELLSLTLADISQTTPIVSLSAGLPFLLIPVNSLAAIKQINLRLDIWAKHFKNTDNRQHLFVFTEVVEDHSIAAYSRMFAPAMGIIEDPATGVASGLLGKYLTTFGKYKDLVGDIEMINLQGVDMGRPSKIIIKVKKTGDRLTQVAIAGESIIIGKGIFYS